LFSSLSFEALDFVSVTVWLVDFKLPASSSAFWRVKKAREADASDRAMVANNRIRIILRGIFSVI
jgi:hypothetical protein